MLEEVATSQVQCNLVGFIGRPVVNSRFINSNCRCLSVMLSLHWCTAQFVWKRSTDVYIYIYIYINIAVYTGVPHVLMSVYVVITLVYIVIPHLCSRIAVMTC